MKSKAEVQWESNPQTTGRIIQMAGKSTTKGNNPQRQDTGAQHTGDTEQRTSCEHHNDPTGNEQTQTQYIAWLIRTSWSRLLISDHGLPSNAGDTHTHTITTDKEEPTDLQTVTSTDFAGRFRELTISEKSYKSESPIAKHCNNTVILASRLVEPNIFALCLHCSNNIKLQIGTVNRKHNNILTGCDP